MSIIKENSEQATMILSVRDSETLAVKQAVSVTASLRLGKGATVSVDVLDNELTDMWFEELQAAITEFMAEEHEKAIDSGIPLPDLSLLLIEPDPEEAESGGG